MNKREQSTLHQADDVSNQPLAGMSQIEFEQIKQKVAEQQAFRHSVTLNYAQARKASSGTAEFYIEKILGELNQQLTKGRVFA